MGLFETYRIAGVEVGIAHFIAQFGSALAWPWAKLMDVPELTDALIQKIADQSDTQSRHHSTHELELIRDDNLVGIMRVQKGKSWELHIRRFETKTKLEAKLHMETMLLDEKPLNEKKDSIRLVHSLYRSSDQTLIARAESSLVSAR